MFRLYRNAGPIMLRIRGRSLTRRGQTSSRWEVMFFLILLGNVLPRQKTSVTNETPSSSFVGGNFSFHQHCIFPFSLIATNGSNNERWWRVFRPTTTPLALNSPHKSISLKLNFGAVEKKEVRACITPSRTARMSAPRQIAYSSIPAYCC